MKGILRNPRFGRRAFLETAGLSGLFAPFLSVPSALAAPRGGGGLVENLVLFTWPNGLEQGWEPTGQSAHFELSPTLAALEPYKEDICIVTGMKSGITNELAAHGIGPRVLWTGAPEVEAAASSHSLDQEIANMVGSTRAYRSLHFGVQTTELGLPSDISQPYCHFLGPRQPIAAVDEPERMFQEIFEASADLDQVAIDRIRSGRQRSLDFVRDRLSRLRGRVSVADRVKVDQHIEGVRALEDSLQWLGRVECSEPRPPLGAASGTAAVRDDQVFPEVADLQMNLATLALQCRLTRVVTIQISHTDSDTKIRGVNPTDGLHYVMHNYGPGMKKAINTWMIGRFADLLGKLKSVDRGNGKTLLDETLVVGASEMAIGNHWNQPMPFIVAGGGGGYFRLGRWVHLDGYPRHTRLLTSVVQAFGANVETFGQYTDPTSVGDLRNEVQNDRF